MDAQPQIVTVPPSFITFIAQPIFVNETNRIHAAKIATGPVQYGLKDSRTIVVINTEIVANVHLSRIGENSVIGFDIEATSKGSKSKKEGETSGEWSNKQTCLIQIACADGVLVLDMTKIKGNVLMFHEPILTHFTAMPNELKRIIESPNIVKCTVGAIGDTSRIWVDYHLQCRRFLDLGFMVRIGAPLLYAEGANDNPNANISLQRCVADVLGFILNKTGRAEYEWKDGLPEEQKEPERYREMLLYAALDAEASLELFEPIQAMVNAQKIALQRELPEYWYCLNYIDGISVRLHKSRFGKDIGWKWTICPWYVEGKFDAFWS
ncbi:ribonuclease H-like domain-containing protein [Favolaschia claudopus]|uniref:Ribonuclease H-like domain-containing protein n=1 Tax=Favolaschia claudopus TaxID=2862362 RepID=A0AAW0DSN7_9AGAR